MEFPEFKNDKKIQDKLKNTQKDVNNIDKILEIALSENFTDNLSMKDKLNYDLFLAYALNTLGWMYHRSIGKEPDVEIKYELNRVKEYMVKSKSAIERHTKRGKIDQDVAKRFIKHGIGHSEKSENDEDESSDEGEPITKKRKT